MLEIHIPTAAETRDRTSGYPEKFKEAIEEQLRLIEKARCEGVAHCPWIFYGNTRYEDMESRVAKLFESMGYTIRPAGMIGGVMQDDKYLCW